MKFSYGADLPVNTALLSNLPLGKSIVQPVTMIIGSGGSFGTARYQNIVFNGLAGTLAVDQANLVAFAAGGDASLSFYYKK